MSRVIPGDRKWVVVCSGNGIKVLFRFVLPLKEKWNFVSGDFNDGYCHFKNTVEDAEEYAIGHIVGGEDNLAYDSVFPMELIGNEAWERMKEMKKAHSLVGDKVKSEEMIDRLINSGVSITMIRSRR